jgi:predicted ATP-dependent endonuclease of OLD family
MSKISINGCKVENLRSYLETSCEFRAFTVLVGENNEGKSSILKMIDKFINKTDETFLSGQRRLTKDEQAFWMPANETRHKARRLTLNLNIPDGRIARSFGGQEHVDLRMSISKSTMRARLNFGPPKRGESHDNQALKLWKKLRKNMDVVLIPAVRDASSSGFAKRLEKHIDETIGTKLHQQGRGGSYKEYRTSLEIMDKLEDIVSMNKQGLDISSAMMILKRMVKDSEIRFEANIDEVLNWIKNGLYLTVSTGSHDILKVRANEVGNGLQSIIDIALTVGSYGTSKQLLLMVEEPEAFLHPSAQRELIIGLQQSTKNQNRQIVVTTHSPLIIDETKYGDVILVRSQHFYSPKVLSDQGRCDINTNLMTASNSELLFANIAIFVEGPGDKVFFDAIFKRLRRLDTDIPLTKLIIQSVGGKRSFAPWIRLLKSYGKENNHPINWLSVMDADAARKDDNGQRAILDALRNSQSTVPKDIESDIIEFGDIDYNNDAKADKAIKLNHKLKRYPCILFSVDLEWAIVCNANQQKQVNRVLNEVFKNIGISPSSDCISIAKKLGSKISGSNPSNACKWPWVRGYIAEIMPFVAFSREIEFVIKSALKLLPRTNSNTVDQFWNNAKQVNPSL